MMAMRWSAPGKGMTIAQVVVMASWPAPGYSSLVARPPDQL